MVRVRVGHQDQIRWTQLLQSLKIRQRTRGPTTHPNPRIDKNPLAINLKK